MNICNNCGKYGHLFFQCKLPITSYGIILFRNKSNVATDTVVQHSLEFLMIRRKDSFGYIDFIRGKYSLSNLTQLLTYIDEMSLKEKNGILLRPFEELWWEMWHPNDTTTKTDAPQEIKGDCASAKRKFEMLKNGVPTNEFENRNSINLFELVEMSITGWCETEWEFPKGRRNEKERDIHCALREFEEETGIPIHQIQIIKNVMPLEEIFIGSNHKIYKHKYFLATLSDTNNANDVSLTNFQRTEVSKMEWFSVNECLESVRPYNFEKKELIIRVADMLNNFVLI